MQMTIFSSENNENIPVEKIKEDIFKILWNNVKSTYPSSTSTHTNAILEQDFDLVISQILNVISNQK